MRGFFSNLSERFSNFMQGRNGMDRLANYVFGAVIVLALIDVFIGTGILTIIAFALLIYVIFRAFSRNISSRAIENARFESWLCKPRAAFSRARKRWSNRATTKYFKCAQCGQSLSVPKGKGTLRITCPKCHTTTTIKS